MERCSALACRALALRKHSNTVKKRLFRSKWEYENVIKPARANPPPVEPLKFQPTYQPPRVLPNGWTPPPEPGVPLPKDTLPFQVERTSVGKWLPVYTDVRAGRTQLITLVRKVRGDLNVMQSEMSKVCNGAEVTIRTGRLEVKGRYTKELREWLAGLGF